MNIIDNIMVKVRRYIRLLSAIRKLNGMQVHTATIFMEHLAGKE